MQDESVAPTDEGARNGQARILGRMPKKGVGRGKGGGPKTQTGKDNSRGNATRHGLCSSRTVILPDEELSEYEAVQQGWREEFAPEGYAEEKLVGELISADWALIRAGRRVAWAEDAAVKEWTEESKHHLELMQRYKTAAERSFYRAWNAVQALRKDRLRMLEKQEKLQDQLRETERELELLRKSSVPVAGAVERARKKAVGAFGASAAKAREGVKTPAQALFKGATTGRQYRKARSALPIR